MKRNPCTATVTRLALVLSIAANTTMILAHPYATCLTNNSGSVSFRLNEAADSVKVVGNVGTLTNELGAIALGLTVTNLSASGLTNGVFSIIVTKAGSGAPTLISDNNNVNNQFFGPRGVAVNKRPASPYFGRVYVGNNPGTAASGRPTSDGIYILNADGTDALGQGNTALTGGLNMVSASASMPWRVRVGRDDDMIYICDFTDTTGNLFRTDPDVSAASGTNVFMPPVGAMASPLNSTMNHGSLSEVFVTGSLANGNLTVYTTDEDYETNPGSQSELNCLWEYNIGSGPFPWTSYPNRKVGNPSITFNASQVMGLDRGANGFFYLLDSRSTGTEYCLTVIDPAGPTVLWNSLTESQNLGSTTDLLNASVSVAVSLDMKYCAVLKASGVVVLMPMNNGLPNLAARSQFTALGASSRAIDFDAADNVYCISSATERLRVYSLGLTTTATSSSDGSFSLTTPSTSVVVTGNADTLFEAAATTANFTIVRNNDALTSPLTVAFSTTGAATRGTDYVLQTNGVTFTNNSLLMPVGIGTVNVTLVTSNDTAPELTEAVNFNIVGTAFYSAGNPNSVPLAIVDDDTNMVEISAIPFPTMFEANTNDFARFTLQRRGDTNAASFDVNLAFRGSATSDVDYAPLASVTIDPGVVTKTFDVHPIEDALLEIPETVIVSVTNGAGYLVGTNSALTTGATATIVDDKVPVETVLFSDNFSTDSSTNWTLFFANTNVDLNPTDYTAVFAFDYSSQGVPPAPHSSGDTLGLLMTVNKGGLFNASGLNVYPNGRNFSNNFALRFDMYLMQNGSAATTEYSLCGINHDGVHTNWFRSSGTGVPAGWTFDGIWAYIEADGAALGDYVLNSAPGVGSVFGPTTLSTRLASTLTTIFHNPPWTSGSGAGAPGNTPTTTTPSWSQVELSQIGKIITLKINNTVIMSYSNTTAFTKGNIMLGYDDAFDSVGSGGGGLVFFDNVRVVSLPAGIQITNIVKVGSSAQIDFTWFENDPASAFKLQTAANVGGPYADDANAATTYSINVPAASYRITTPATNTARFLRIRHQ